MIHLQWVWGFGVGSVGCNGKDVDINICFDWKRENIVFKCWANLCNNILLPFLYVES